MPPRTLPHTPVGLVLAAVLGWLLPSPQPAQASEIDSFTHRYDGMVDALETLDQMAATWLSEAVVKANQASACNRDRLYREVRARMVGPNIEDQLWGAFERAIIEAPDIDKRFTTFADSVFRDVDFLEAPVLYLTDLGPIVNVDSHVVGADKFGHFFSEGYKYFERGYLDGEGREAAVSLGIFTEEELFGEFTTGVYSHADLAANFSGMQFWLRLLGEHVPVDTPYVVCEHDQWTLNATLSWRDYVDASWDEGINCNRYRSARMTERIHRRLRELEQSDDLPYLCPTAPDTCATVVAANRYGPYGHDNVSPLCIEAAAAAGVYVTEEPDDTDNDGSAEEYFNYFGMRCSGAGGAAGAGPTLLLALLGVSSHLRKHERSVHGAASATKSAAGAASSSSA